ncbi:MAG: PD-(D/E)XK nuclease family protein [Mogibacterium sp.]|nr:PD-(D/E)XK nuclease family protein [Mogibacterium sp.]
MLRLFAGRENTDKERFIYDSIKECGGETLVLVPDQYTLVAEEQALRYLGTECLFDTEILSMNRLGLRVLTEQGTESVRMLDKYGRFMLLSMIIKEKRDELEIFQRSAGKLTFTSMINDFISEFKQQDCSFAQLKELIAGSGDDPILEAKLSELSGIIEAYEEAIKGKYTDSEDYISMYTAAIKDSKLARGKNIWIYGYDSITPKFADAMLELANVSESVNLIVNQSDFGLDEKLIGSLAALARERCTDFSFEEIEGYERQSSETVARIESSLWKDVLSEAEKEANSDFVPDDLTMVCAANPYYEAESAASYVWHLVRDLGYKMNEIQVIANDESAMQPMIRRIFAEYGLPLFADSSRRITDSAAVSFIADLLSFARSRRVSSYLFAALKTGLTDFADSDIEDLENYARAYRIKGSMWTRPFKYGREDIGEELFDKLETMRDVIDKKVSGLERMAKSGSTSGFTAAFRSYLEEEWQLSDKVTEAAEARDNEGLHDEAQRMSQSYEKAVEILDQIDSIMGDSDMDLAAFTDIYTTGLSDVEVGVIPPSVDGLSMGTMIRTRPRQMRAAVIIGANEGVLPLRPGTEGLFSIDEKKYFKSKGFSLGELDDLKMDEENAAMYRMMARPSEKIYISWSMTDSEGKDAAPSPVIESLKALFPRIDRDGLIKKDVISAGWGSAGLSGNNSLSGRSLPGGDRSAAGDLINTPEDSMRHLISRMKTLEREGDAEAGPDPLSRALTCWYSDRQSKQLQTMIKAASYDNDPAPLSKNISKELFGRSDGSLVLSASSINSYIDCPFSYYVGKGLKPKEERAFASDSRSVGDVYHECLMAVARQLMGDKNLLLKLRETTKNAETVNELDYAVHEERTEETVRDAVGEDIALKTVTEGRSLKTAAERETSEPGNETLEKIVNDALDDISANYRGGLFISAGNEEYRMSRIREICAAAAKAMASQLAAGSMTGADFEKSFGRRGRFEPIKLNIGGDEVWVEGKIDRADYMDIDGEERVRIIDYKTGSDKLDLRRMRQGVKMQLMIYLISASSGKKEPAGMFYFNIKDPIEAANDLSDSKEKALETRKAEDEFKLKGVYIDEEGVLGAMPENVLASSKGGISREDYEAVRSDVIARIEETASGILSGKIGINPLKDSNSLPCSWCGYKAICRRDRGYVKNYARTLK